ncbi:MAG: dihydroorotate dehydrogenase [Rhodobacteraceae bacterium]|nr:dihydroorotate dehydrogenase [Paracoccaceae bacterium]
MTDTELEALFAAGREATADPSAALLARVMDDAMAQIEGRAVPAAAAVAAPLAPARRGLLRGAFRGAVAALGGWPSMAGLASAAIAGLWIGYAGPAGLDTVTGALWSDGYEVSDLVPSIDAFLTEG